MKWLVILLIALGIGYYFFQPTIDKMFGKVTTQYERDVEQNRLLSN